MQQQQGSGGSGQYGAPEVPQFVGGRGGHAHSHMLGISSHEMPHHSHSDHQQPQQQPQHHLQQSQQQLLQHSQPQQQQSNCNNQQQKTDSLAEIPSPIASRPPPPPPRSTNSFEQLVPLGSSFGDDEALAGDDGERGSSAGNRWPRQETLALLKIRSDMDAAFRDASLKGPLWEEVSRKLEELGYHRSAKKCKEKFENVHKYYKRTKDGRAGRQDGKSYRFFSQLEALHSNNNNSSSSNANNARNNYANAMDTGGGAAARLQAPSAVMLNNSNTTAELNRNASATVNPVVIKHSADFSAGISFSSESSEDDEYDDQTDSRKRKRGSSSTKKMMIFFETLMKQVMEKQELMQQKFLESIEKREQDRMIREEAWKRQEMARLNREHEIMAQERAISASRDAAFIAFLQKITGQNFQVPLMAPLAQSTTTLNPPPQEIQRRIGVDQEVHADQLELSFDPNSTRWPKPEVHALIRLRSGMEPKYQDTGPKGPLWEEISAGMSRLGYIRSAKRCKEKWENINKYFKKVKESNKKRPEDAKTCPYFHQLDQLYRKRILSGNPNTNTSSKQDQLNQEETCIEPSGDNNNNNNNNDRTEGQSDDILAIMPPPVSSSDNTKNNNNGPASAMIPSSNGPVSAPFYSTTSAENATGADQRALKKPECLMMDMDLDDVMQSAQQHQQSVLDDYDKMEQEDSDTNNNLDDPDNITHDKQSTVDHLPFAQFVHERTSSSASTAANSFMAMVHRLAASDPPEFKSSKA